MTFNDLQGSFSMTAQCTIFYFYNEMKRSYVRTLQGIKCVGINPKLYEMLQAEEAKQIILVL